MSEMRITPVSSAPARATLASFEWDGGSVRDSRGNALIARSVADNTYAYVDFATRELALATQPRLDKPTAITIVNMREPTALERSMLKCKPNGDVMSGKTFIAHADRPVGSQVGGRDFAYVMDARYAVPTSTWAFYVFDITDRTKPFPLVGAYDFGALLPKP